METETDALGAFVTGQLVVWLGLVGGLLAMVPVLLALTAVAGAFGVMGPISQAIPIDDSVKTVLLLIGMAVGVDYALFYLKREREERAAGRSHRGGTDPGLPGPWPG